MDGAGLESIDRYPQLRIPRVRSPLAGGVPSVPVVLTTAVSERDIAPGIWVALTSTSVRLAKEN